MTNNQHCNKAGKDIIRAFEGLRLKSYRCPASVWTIGYGHTAGVGPGLTCTEAQADAWLVEDLQGAEAAIRRYVNAPLTSNQFSALASWTFNLGAGALWRSTLRRKLNAREYAAVPDEMRRWVKAGGKTLRGLVKRRAAEAKLFEKP